MTIHAKCFRELQKELPLETNIHCIRIVAQLKLFHRKQGELLSLDQESMQELPALGTEPHRQTGISFFLRWAHLPHFHAFQEQHSYLPFIFHFCLCTNFQSVFEPCFRKCFKQVIYFYWCILNLFQPKKTTFTIYNKNAKYIAYALNLSSYRSVHEKISVVKVKAI